MLQQYHTKLKGTLALTDSYLTEKALQKEKGLYKFIWVRQGSITVEIDHQEMVLSKDDVISLTHLQHLEFKSIEGEYMTLLFNSNFYCIYGNDHEVSCSGFLFNGSSHLVRFTLNEKERRQLDQITEAMENEFTVSDSLQEEMLRILLKRFIIQCTRIARQRLDITREKESGFEIVRQYYNLVDEHPTPPSLKAEEPVRFFSRILRSALYSLPMNPSRSRKQRNAYFSFSTGFSVAVTRLAFLLISQSAEMKWV